MKSVVLLQRERERLMKKLYLERKRFSLTIPALDNWVKNSFTRQQLWFRFTQTVIPELETRMYKVTVDWIRYFETFTKGPQSEVV